MINIFKGKPYLPIHTPYIEEFIDVAEYALNRGYFWNGGDYNICKMLWYDYKERTCINVEYGRIYYADYVFYIRYYKHVLEYRDFYTMTKLNDFI